MNATTTNNETITIKLEINAQDLWEAVFGSSALSWGYWWLDVDYIGDTEWDKIGKVKLTGLFDENKNIKKTKTLTLKEIANALPLANNQVSMDLFNFDNYDAICADAVLQQAVFGKVIYG